MTLVLAGMCCSTVRWGLLFFLPLPYKHLCKNKTHFPGGSLEELTTVPSGHWPCLCPCHEHFVGLNPCLQHQPNDSAPKTKLQKPQTLTLQGKTSSLGIEETLSPRNTHTLDSNTIDKALSSFFFFLSFLAASIPFTPTHTPAPSAIGLPAHPSHFPPAKVDTHFNCFHPSSPLVLTASANKGPEHPLPY